MSKKHLNSRLYLVFLFFVLVLSLLIARLAYIQIFKSTYLKTLALEQHSFSTQIQPFRGIILDRKFRELAVNTISYSIFATDEVPAEKKLITKIASILNLEDSDLLEKLNSNRRFIWLKRKISPEVCAKIKNLNIPGIGQVKEYERFYPNGSLASHILGFVDIDNRGLEGLELYCDSYLSGIKGWRLAQKDAKKREVICWGYKSILPSDGYNLILTIDNVVQNITERELHKAVRKYNATSATAIVMQPKTGEILALCNYPDYDLNGFGEYEAGVRRNLAITDIFEPGSSFKFVAAACALEENLVKPKDKFYCEQGKYRIGGRILHDYKPLGQLTFKEIIEQSSNIGIVKAIQRVDEKILYEYIKDFGFGSLTGIDFPGEVKGIVRPPDKWSRVSISSIPIGQEIAVTSIQLISAISCVANDGILVKPKILKFIQRKDGKIIKSYPTEKLRRVISVETAQALKRILTGAVDNGTGKKAKVAGYKTAGKTGTAQKAKPRGGYYKHRYFSSFIGFVPAEEPVISVLVVLNEPRPLYFGSKVCAPVFRRIASATLRYLKMSEELSEN